jgi:hypothetical protein
VLCFEASAGLFTIHSPEIVRRQHRSGRKPHWFSFTIAMLAVFPRMHSVDISQTVPKSGSFEVNAAAPVENIPPFSASSPTGSAKRSRTLADVTVFVLSRWQTLTSSGESRGFCSGAVGLPQQVPSRGPEGLVRRTPRDALLPRPGFGWYSPVVTSTSTETFVRDAACALRFDSGWLGLVDPCLSSDPSALFDQSF